MGTNKALDLYKMSAILRDPELYPTVRAGSYPFL
jgi:hypothetical protein